MKKSVVFLLCLTALLALSLAGPISNTVAVIPASQPAAPINLTATATSIGINVSWTGTDNNISGFEVERKVSGGSYAQIGTATGTINPTGTNIYQDIFVSSNTTYYYRVRAYNSAGDSPYSNEASATFTGTPLTPPSATAPAAPSNLSAIAAAGDLIALSWTDNSGDEDGFKIERRDGSGSFVQVGTSGSNLCSYSDATVTPGGNYTYRVRAFNSFGDSAYSNTAGITTPVSPAGPAVGGIQPPIEPSALKAAFIPPDSVELTWTDNSDNEMGFIIERDSGSGFVQVGDSLPDAPAFVDAGLKSGVVYRYRVKAYNNGGESDCSNEVVVETSTTPAPFQPGGNPGEPTTMRFIIGSRESFVNDQFKEIDVAPVILDGRTLLPVKFVAEPLGASTGWDASEKKTTVTLGSKTIELWVGKNTALVDGNQELIDPNNPDVVPVVLPPGRTMLPLRFVTENLGCKVDWDAATQTVTITSQNSI